MQNILLVGEYSGVHKNLKEGLLAHGVNAVTASTGDLWKCINSDIHLGSGESSTLARMQRIIYAFLKTRRLVGYELVQFVTSGIFNPRINSVLMRHLMKSNGKSFLLAAGCDATYYNGVKSLAYSPCSKCLEQEQVGECPHTAKCREESHNDVCNSVDGIIPVMYDYAVSYRSMKNVRATIPLPLNTSQIQYKENKVGSKVRIFHGVNREGFKGTQVIRTALEQVRQRFSKEVEVIVEGKMPLGRYLELLATVNIVVDQCNSYSYGMNALYSMAQGKVVLSGAEPECLAELGVRSCPVTNIKPEVCDIAAKLEHLITQRNRITELGYRSRIFAEQFHDAARVAGQYLKTWKT